MEVHNGDAMKRLSQSLFVIAVLAFFMPAISHAQLGDFNIRPITDADFYTFIKVFSEMRGPLRSEILKDSKTDFKKADPLKYVGRIKDNAGVQTVLKDNGLNWDGFNDLMGNILLGYFSIQPDKTKAGLLRQLSDYGLMMSSDQIPPEYQQVVKEALKTDEGAELAGMALEFIVQIPPENVALAKKNKRQLDQLFYTRFWKDRL